LVGRRTGNLRERIQSHRAHDGAFHPQVRTVFELGGESAKYIRLEPHPKPDSCGIVDYDRSGECAAGTGSFLDQQASRMGYSVEEIGEVVCTANCAARIAGRCSVFAKSDMIHAQQKGYTPAEILRGLCDAVARNFKSAVVKGRPVVPPVALIGAVSQNAGSLGPCARCSGWARRICSFPNSMPGAAPSARRCWRPSRAAQAHLPEIHRLAQHEPSASRTTRDRFRWRT
jgi:hypothetical protein